VLMGVSSSKRFRLGGGGGGGGVGGGAGGGGGGLWGVVRQTGTVVGLGGFGDYWEAGARWGGSDGGGLSKQPWRRTEGVGGWSGGATETFSR